MHLAAELKQLDQLDQVNELRDVHLLVRVAPDHPKFHLLYLSQLLRGCQLELARVVKAVGRHPEELGLRKRVPKEVLLLQKLQEL